jgi:uncharacterized protein YyaL (SSP411 family)
MILRASATREILGPCRASGEQVIVDVGAYWCDSCHELDEQVFSLPRVAAAVEAGYLAVKNRRGEG